MLMLQYISDRSKKPVHRNPTQSNILRTDRHSTGPMKSSIAQGCASTGNIPENNQDYAY